MNENPNTGAGDTDPNRQHDSASVPAEEGSTPEQQQHASQQGAEPQHPAAADATAQTAAQRPDAATAQTPVQQPAHSAQQPAANPQHGERQQFAPPVAPQAAAHAQHGAQHAAYQQQGHPQQHGHPQQQGQPQPQYGQYAQQQYSQQQPSPGSHHLPGAAFGPAATGPGTQQWAPPAQNAQNAQKKPRNRRAGVAVAALALAALVGGVSGAGITSLIGGGAGSSSVAGVEHANPTSVTVNDTEDVNLVTAVAAQATPSVVTISVSGGDASGSGSGVIISDDGYVLTNNHVVSLDGSVADPSIQVTDSEGRLYDATIVGTDPVYDLAVIKLDGASDLTPVEFANSDDLNVGDRTIAIGAPLGLSNTVTDGIVSSLNRSISVASSEVPDGGSTDQGEGNQQSPYDFWGFDLPGQEQQQQASSTISLSVIQTDAAINPGNSGGALLDANGDLIGINVAIATAGGGGTSSSAGSIGVGFSIPSNVAERISSELIANGEATHGLLGATVGDVTSTDQSSTVGALIDDVSPGGAAAAAGLRSGDVVTAIDGKPVTSMSDLVAQVRAQAAGASVTITYNRGDGAGEVEVTLGSM
ncbi:S1C family serine protease [Arenivirga flava]|uniref:PDZ domain-containing protein n=1 Tax=Arenivirga flava TaxID=1930060 RepID=A0AA37XCF7_9MICO|nr:trypsin-like peptidase domain-containing protein [Arenivirga flava]GMA26751.1 hypothetical protein GCM10025874_00040 [Arenivirga flava]GMA29865.1 hypothetical protein GCM10025874_31180 [Arenivirga flava]